MLIVYRYPVAFPSRKAHTIQIANTCHALARAGAEVWLYTETYTEDSPETCLQYYGLPPHENLKLCLPPQWTERSKRWRGPIARFWEGWRFGHARKRAPVFFLRDGEDSYAYIQRLAERKAAWNCLNLLELHRLHAMELEEYTHSDAPEHDRKKVGNALKRRAGQENAALHAADGLLPISATLGGHAVERYGKLPPTRVLPSGTAPAEDEPTPVSERSGVVYVGQLYPWKGTDTMIEAMQSVDATLTIVGGNDEAGLSGTKALASNLGVESKIEFKGHRPHKEAIGFLRKARCTVVPLGNHIMARAFTSPVKLFEAMAAGTPLVATDLPTTREVLTHEQNALLVPPDDAEATAQAVTRLLNDDELAQRLQRAALRDVYKYTWDQRAKNIIDFINELRTR